jgi:phosphoribosylanthranilate isomerase
MKEIKGQIAKVGVFVNTPYDELMETVDQYRLDMVQLHGDESPEMCEDLSSEVEVIKAFRIKEGVTDIDALVAAYDAVCDYYLFEKQDNSFGGTGKQFDWSF